MIKEYLIELVGEVPQSLEVFVYFLCTLLVFFGLFIVLKLISIIFRKFF